MITDFLLLLMTKNLAAQLKFYRDLLNLELIFDNKDVVGLGQDSRLFIVLREDVSGDSHHLTEQKGPQIITFRGLSLMIVHNPPHPGAFIKATYLVNWRFS